MPAFLISSSVATRATLTRGCVFTALSLLLMTPAFICANEATAKKAFNEADDKGKKPALELGPLVALMNNPPKGLRPTYDTLKREFDRKVAAGKFKDHPKKQAEITKLLTDANTEIKAGEKSLNEANRAWDTGTGKLTEARMELMAKKWNDAEKHANEAYAHYVTADTNIAATKMDVKETPKKLSKIKSILASVP